MDRSQRAKQFMPFAALKGYEEALRAKEKIIVQRADLSEEMREELDRCIQRMKPLNMVKVVHFSKGEYLETIGVVSKIDFDAKLLIVVDKKILFSDIYAMEIL